MAREVLYRVTWYAMALAGTALVANCQLEGAYDLCSDKNIKDCENLFAHGFEIHAFPLAFSADTLDHTCSEAVRYINCLALFEKACPTYQRLEFLGTVQTIKYVCDQGKQPYLSSIDCIKKQTVGLGITQCHQIYQTAKHEILTNSASGNSYKDVHDLCNERQKYRTCTEQSVNVHCGESAASYLGNYFWRLTMADFNTSFCAQDVLFLGSTARPNLVTTTIVTFPVVRPTLHPNPGPGLQVSTVVTRGTSSSATAPTPTTTPKPKQSVPTLFPTDILTMPPTKKTSGGDSRENEGPAVQEVVDSSSNDNSVAIGLGVFVPFAVLLLLGLLVLILLKLRKQKFQRRSPATTDEPDPYEELAEVTIQPSAGGAAGGPISGTPISGAAGGQAGSFANPTYDELASQDDVILSQAVAKDSGKKGPNEEKKHNPSGELASQDELGVPQATVQGESNHWGPNENKVNPFEEMASQDELGLHQATAQGAGNHGGPNEKKTNPFEEMASQDELGLHQATARGAGNHWGPNEKKTNPMSEMASQDELDLHNSTASGATGRRAQNGKNSDSHDELASQGELDLPMSSVRGSAHPRAPTGTQLDPYDEMASQGEMELPRSSVRDAIRAFNNGMKDEKRPRAELPKNKGSFLKELAESEEVEITNEEVSKTKPSDK